MNPWVWTGVAAVAIAAAGLFWATGVSKPSQPAAKAAPASSAKAPSAAGPGAGTVTAPAPQSAASTESDVLTAEERQALRAELSGRPDAEAEFQRIVGHLNFSRQWEAFQAARTRGDDPARLAALAAALDAALPARWQGGELTGPQAIQLKSQLLEVLLSNDAERQTVLKSWQASLQPSRGPSAAERQFLEEQARLLAAYRAQPVAKQNPAALKAQLEALRTKSFGSNPSP